MSLASFALGPRRTTLVADDVKEDLASVWSASDGSGPDKLVSELSDTSRFSEMKLTDLQRL